MTELRCTDVHSAIADLPSGTADQRARAFSEGGPSASLAQRPWRTVQDALWSCDVGKRSCHGEAAT